MSEQEVKNMKRQRAGIEGYLKRVYAEKIKPCMDNVENMSDGDWNLISGHWKIFVQKLAVIGELNTNIANGIEDEEEYQTEFDKGMNLELDLTVKIEALERLLQSRQASFPPSISSQNVVQDVENLSTSFQKTVKLPMLQIKKFDGNPNDFDFQTFFESFEETVHKNKNLAAVQKMGYLMSFLTGEAENCLKGLRMNNDNYEKALSMLKDRFGQPQVLISHHITKILDLETVWSISDVKVLRNLYDCVETQLRNLESLKMKPEEYGPMLIPVLMSKIPDELKLILSRERDWTLKNILEKMKLEIEAREKVKLRGDDASANFFTATNQNKRFECVYCGKTNHKSFQCRMITKPTSRKEVLMKQKRCFLCLKQGHSVRDCRSKMSCYTCNKKHHSSICFGKAKNSHLSDKTEEENLKTKQEETLEPQQRGREPLETQNSYASAGSTVLLQTAKAKVSDTNNQNLGHFRILFDSGSQLSYISPEVRKKLNLRTIGKRELTIKSFGGGRQTKVLDVVEFVIETNTGPEKVEAFVSEISYPLRDQNTEVAKETYQHIRSLNLADKNSNNCVNIDILIGSNYYWHFIDGKRIIKGKLGEPVAISSNLGYILSGTVQNNFEETECLATHVLEASVSHDEKLEILK